jgi:MFS family permease
MPQADVPLSILAKLFAVICLPFGYAYFLSYLFRSINAVISEPLRHELNLNAADLGLLTAAYFLGFAAFQIPLGLLLDRYGPRKVQSLLLTVAAVGALVFSLGQSSSVLMLGRTLIGIGVAGGLMASFKAITVWFPQKRWPQINGLFMAMGGIGAMAATTPIQQLLQITDWRGIFQLLAGLTLLGSVLIFFIVPERKDKTPVQNSLKEQLDGMMKVFKDKLFWRIAPIGFLAMSSGMAIQGLWAGPWLRDIAELPPAEVAEHLFVLSLALTLGFVATGFITEAALKIGMNKVQVIGIGGLILTVTIFLIMMEVHPDGYWVWIIFGFLGNLAVVSYPVLTEHFGLAVAGRANAALNLLVFVSAFTLQFLMGWIIDLWPASETGGYESQAYLAAFGFIDFLLLLALIWFILSPRLKP